MRTWTLAAIPLLVLGSSAFAGEKINGQNRDFQTLSEVSSPVPGHEGQVVKQYSQTFKVQNAGIYNGTATEVGQQQFNGESMTFKGHGATQTSATDTAY